MQISKWYDHEARSERIFLELSPRQADKLLTFLFEQQQEGYKATTLTIPGVYNKFGRHGEEESSKSVITIGIV